jgi:hypothetical protein
MSYHRAKVLPHVQPMRNFAEAHGPYESQRRYVVPPPTPNTPTVRQLMARRAMGNSGDGLSGVGLGAALVVL